MATPCKPIAQHQFCTPTLLYGMHAIEIYRECSRKMKSGIAYGEK